MLLFTNFILRIFQENPLPVRCLTSYDMRLSTEPLTCLGLSVRLVAIGGLLSIQTQPQLRFRISQRSRRCAFASHFRPALPWRFRSPLPSPLASPLPYHTRPQTHHQAQIHPFSPQSLPQIHSIRRRLACLSRGEGSSGIASDHASDLGSDLSSDLGSDLGSDLDLDLGSDLDLDLDSDSGTGRGSDLDSDLVLNKRRGSDLTSAWDRSWNTDTPLLVVVARYNEDVSWTNNVTHPVIVYEKQKPWCLYNTAKNKAKEASSYLQFLCEFYDFLPQHVAFTHATDTSWHHRGKLQNKLRQLNLPINIGYKSLNRNRLNSIVKHPQHFEPHLSIFWSKVMEKYFGPMELYGDFTINHKGSAQFIVSREMILRRPLSLYLDLYKWTMECDMNDFWSSRMLEYTWHVIFMPDKFPLRPSD
ncbi:hypothetical protein AAMO2058_000500500 [Amorphochlora amoebiformis]